MRETEAEVLPPEPMIERNDAKKTESESEREQPKVSSPPNSILKTTPALKAKIDFKTEREPIVCASIKRTKKQAKKRLKRIMERKAKHNLGDNNRILLKGCSIGGVKCRVMIDNGADTSVVSQEFVEEHYDALKHSLLNLPEALPLNVATGSSIEGGCTVRLVEL